MEKRVFIQMHRKNKNFYGHAVLWRFWVPQRTVAIKNFKKILRAVLEKIDKNFKLNQNGGFPRFLTPMNL